MSAIDKITTNVVRMTKMDLIFNNIVTVVVERMQ